MWINVWPEPVLTAPRVRPSHHPLVDKSGWAQEKHDVSSFTGRCQDACQGQNPRQTDVEACRTWKASSQSQVPLHLTRQRNPKLWDRTSPSERARLCVASFCVGLPAVLVALGPGPRTVARQTAPNCERHSRTNRIVRGGGPSGMTCEHLCLMTSSRPAMFRRSSAVAAGPSPEGG